MTRRATDLLIVGGGPAGAALAALAAAAGARVTLIDRASFPRDKVCGEFLSAEGCAVLRRLGLLDELARHGRSIDRARISDRRGRLLPLRLPGLAGGGREALGLSRRRLDLALIEHAARCGARVEERCEALRPDGEGQEVGGVVLRPVGSGSGGSGLTAALVVAADGRRSILLRHLRGELGDPQRSRPASWFGIKVHLEGCSPADPCAVELHLFDGGYAGLAPIEDSRFNLCALVTVRALRACGGSPDRLLRERILHNPAAQASIGAAGSASRWHSVGPLRFGERCTSARGVLFLGDAAGTVDPFCGEGMSNALIGAELALPFVLRALERGRLTPGLALAYERAWRRRFHAVTVRSRLLGRLLQQPVAGHSALWFLRGPGRRLAPRLVAATRTGWRA